MASLVFKSILLSALLGVVFCDSPEVRVVKRLISASNKAFRKHNETEIPLPDVGWVFEPVRYRNGRLGEFDTLELLPHPKIEKRTNHYGTVYTFNVSTALEDLRLTYNFFVNYPFFGSHGNVTITVGEKAFQLDGRVLVKSNGTCFAVLQDAKVVKFGDFKVDFQPDDAPYITKLYERVLNFVHRQVVPLINQSIRTKITKTEFRKNFNKYVCEEVKRTLIK